LRLLKDKVRVYALARELDMESKDLLDLCRQQGYDVKNQLSSLEPDQRDVIEALVRKGSRGGTAVAAPPPPSPAPLPVDIGQKVRVLPQARRQVQREAEPPAPPAPLPAPAAVVPASPPPQPVPEIKPPVAPAAVLPETPAPARAPEPPVTSPAPTVVESPRPAPEIPPAVRPPDAGGRPPDLAAKGPPTLTSGPSKMRTLDQQPRSDSGIIRPRRDRQIRPPVLRVAPLPQLKKAVAKQEPKKQEPITQTPIKRLPDTVKHGNVTPQEALKIIQGAPTAPAVDIPEEIEDDDKKGKARPGGVAGRDKRHLARNERAKKRKDAAAETEIRGGRVLTSDDDSRPGRKLTHKLRKEKGPKPRVGKVPIEMPITVRKLSEAVGRPVVDLLFRLRDHGAAVNITINSTIEPVMAEVIAHDVGCEIEIKRPPDAEELLLAGFDKPGDPENLVLRAPVVAVMGHVDHGKTSLLDRIRKSNVVATEAGGITQVIRAWRVDHGGRPVTFLDTPGHEAFTKMRARGAQVTDIAVIVVAADDGVMPQTEEAISHARAAGVPIVVAINKVDLPNANLNKTRQQLYSMGLIPDTMGGDTPFVETSAATGKGIDELLDMLSLVAELKELKADPTKLGSGTCLEAMLSEGEGVRATLLVRTGTLHRGDIILCGATYGRVRALYDDQGRPIQEAGPSVPVRITGLDEVPNADDPFVVAPDLATAQDIADKRKDKLQAASLFQRAPVTLEKLSEAKIAELKIILKADFRGSIEAIKKELEKLKHAEVRVNVLHTGIGAITESDVVLALTSPEDTIIVGFNVVPDDRAKALAEERGVQIREYDIIYNLTDEIRSALEGKLKPHEQVIHLGRAVVRETFKISRVGTVAGCYVTQGTIERSAKVRLIRQGVIIYPPTDRTASLESLKRFKEDTREVREGFECGMKIAGYDDLKVDDVIEAYRIEQVQRTL
jgi:translation initiation factor IF-2